MKTRDKNQLNHNTNLLNIMMTCTHSESNCIKCISTCKQFCFIIFLDMCIVNSANLLIIFSKRDNFY